MVKKRVRLTKEEKKRATIQHSLISNLGENLHGDVSDAIRYLHELISEYSEYDALYITTEYWEGEHSTLALTGTKLETDDQYEERIAKLKEDIAKEIKRQEAADKKLYKQLKKKYGDKWT